MKKKKKSEGEVLPKTGNFWFLQKEQARGGGQLRSNGHTKQEERKGALVEAPAHLLSLSFRRHKTTFKHQKKKSAGTFPLF